MAESNLMALDLNLLISLDAILQERSVTRAATKLHLSQPSVSRSLAKLRVLFGDELLNRHGNNYELTPFAVALAERTTAAVQATRAVFTDNSDFDPATFTREFTIYGSDYTHATVGFAASAEASRIAPGASFRFMTNGTDRYDDVIHQLDQNDATMLPHGLLSGMPSVDVLNDQWVCLISSDNTLVGDELTLDDLSSLQWVVTHQPRNTQSPAMRQLQMVGVEPQIACIVDGFLTVPWFIKRSDRIALMPGHLAYPLVAEGGLRAIACPYDAVPMTASLYWHPKYNDDPGHQWMRNLLAKVGQSEFGPGAVHQLHSRRPG